jgi:hypothetical protein
MEGNPVWSCAEYSYYLVKSCLVSLLKKLIHFAGKKLKSFAGKSSVSKKLTHFVEKSFLFFYKAIYVLKLHSPIEKMFFLKVK